MKWQRGVESETGKSGLCSVMKTREQNVRSGRESSVKCSREDKKELPIWTENHFSGVWGLGDCSQLVSPEEWLDSENRCSECKQLLPV